MIHRQMEAWKKFIQGRIAQEQGREEEGLRAFEQALEIDPNNQYFREASEVAQRSLSRDLSQSDEDLLAHVQESYEQLRPSLTSQKDERVDGLKKMLAELDGLRPLEGYVRTYKGGLHCGWSRSGIAAAILMDPGAGIE
jgi:tetratricopeptide (TPR) repeat protein